MALAQRKAHLAALRRAAKHQQIQARAARTPRPAWAHPTNTRQSSTGFQPGGSPEDAAIRDALARRDTWTEPRQPLLEPAQVQDPPAAMKTAARVREGVLMASQPAAPAPNEDLIREALRNRGVRYVWGGASRGGFDCSGLICYVFAKQRGMKLPHSASAQARLGAPVSSENLQPGDLVFFSTYRPGISHVGLYIGGNRFIHAANRRSDVRVDHLTGYYAHRIRAARRLSPVPLRFTPQDLKDYLHEPSETPQVGS